MRQFKEKIEQLDESIGLEIYKAIRGNSSYEEKRIVEHTNRMIGTNVDLLKTLTKEQLIEIILLRELHLNSINEEIHNEMEEQNNA